MSRDNICGLFPHEEPMHPLIDKILKQLLWEIGKINLQHCKQCEHSAASCKDLCTVHTTFSGGYHIRFAFCAERALMKRITEGMLEGPVTDPEDIEEYMKEFVNILCGHIVSSVFHMTKISARFHSPDFTEGNYIPPDGNENTIVTTYYTNEYSETAMLLHDRLSLTTC